MSIRARRNSLLKSSISIGGIRDSVTKFTDGLFKSNKTAGEIVQKTNDNNNFKRKLIGKDNEFFRKRQENVRRKDREDELEASSVQGIAKRTGSLTASSTRGFLGRILDFVGILILGWALTNLPKIIATFQKLFGFIRRTVGILSGFVEGIKNFLLTLGTGVDNFLAIFDRFNFREDDKNIRDTFEQTQNNLTKLDREFVESAEQFARDKDISRAGEVAAELGLDNAEASSGGLESLESDVKGELEKTFSQAETDALDAGGTLDEDNNVLDAEGNLVEGVEAGAADLTLTDEEARQQIESEDADDIVGTQSFSDEDVTGDADSVEGVGEDNESILSSGGSGGGSAPSLGGGASGGVSLDVDEDERSDDKIINPSGKKDQSLSVKPIKRNFFNLFGRRKKKTTIIQVNNQGNMNNVSSPSMNGGSKTQYISLGQSTEKTLLDLQSLNNKQN